MKQILRLGESYGLFPVKRYIRYVLLIHIGAAWLLNNKAQAQTQPRTVTGTVISASDGKSLEGATVKLKSGGLGVMTDKDGSFRLSTSIIKGTLIVTFIGYQPEEIAFGPDTKMPITLKLEEKGNELEEVQVSTGYQQIPKERATGSFTQPDRQMFDGRVSKNVISKLQGITSGLVFNSGLRGPSTNSADINIRGRSTIYANDQPLIVVDNFPYDGNINDLNNQDIASVTILKDAAAASIWGVKAGNGVIVITTKKGKANEGLSISANANTTIGEKPDLWYDKNFLPSPEYIDLQQYLFEQGKYDANLNNKTSYPMIPAAVEIMAAARNGTISKQDSADQINHLKGIDIRDGLEKYYYRNPISQQYALNISSGSKVNTYYVSLGYDKNISNQTSISDDRLTLGFSNTYKPIKNLEIDLQLNYIRTNANSGSVLSLANATGVSSRFFPYVAFADESGTPLPMNYLYSNEFIEVAKEKNYLPWEYVPLNDINAENDNTKTDDARIQGGLKYEIINGLSAEIKYQYQQYNNHRNDLRKQELYSTTDLINKYSVLTDGIVTNYNVPLGDIYSIVEGKRESQNFRTQINYSKPGKHAVYALAGLEVIQYKGTASNNLLYGYDPETDQFTLVDYTHSFNQNPTGLGRITSGVGITHNIDRYRSYFSNTSYTYDDKITVSASARMDGSNYFGVATNKKTVPLWSSGIKWNLSKEELYSADWISDLSIRGSYGYSGNLNKTVTGITTFQYAANAEYTGLPYAQISNLGNPELTWEKSQIINVGVDFALLNHRLYGNIDYYRKRGIDLIGDQILPPNVGYLSPTTGTNVLRGNFANTKGTGMDLLISSRNLVGNLKWGSTLNFSYAADIVTKYEQINSSYASFPLSSGGSILPYVGKPVYGIYSFRWAGLNPQDGDPQGYVDGNVSKDYGRLTTPRSMDELVYAGNSRPKFFGGIGNNFHYKNFSLWANISYKLGYYFRRPTINYSTLTGTGMGNEDYYLRWVRPGDEKSTNVPSFLYPSNSQRDSFYGYSEVTVEKGDHIRLQDISLSYDLNLGRGMNTLKSVQFYLYSNNLGILWRKNKKGIDPDFAFGGIPYSRTFSFGIKASI